MAEAPQVPKPVTARHHGAEGAGKRAAKNTVVRAAAEVIGKLATFVLFAALARGAGQTGVGVFVFAFAFLQICLMPVGFGCDSYLLRQVAKDRSAADRLFFSIIGLKLVLAGPVLAVSLVAVSLLGYDTTARTTVYLLSVGLLLDLFAKTFHSIFDATERGHLHAVPLILQRVVTAALGVTALTLGYGVVTVAALYSVGAALGLAACVFLMHRHVGMPRRAFDRHGWRTLAATSLPFAIQDVFTVLLFKLDAVILSFMAAEAAVGRYGAAYRLLEATLFIGWALNGAFGAMYAYLGRDTDPTVGSVYERSIKVALVLLTPCAVVMGVLAEPICRLSFGSDFVAAAPALRLLSPVVLGLCLVTLSSSLIISRRSPRTMVRMTASMVLLNVLLNVSLIPSLEERGAALAMLITEIAFVGVAMRVASDEVGGLRWAVMLAAPLTAGIAMLPAMILLVGLPVASLATGLAVYVAAFVLLERRISPGDLAFVAAMLKGRLPARLRRRVTDVATATQE